MRRPLVVFTIGYVIGIIWGLYVNYSIALLYLIITLFYLLIKIKQNKKEKFKIISFKRYFRYIKLILNLNTCILILISSLISYIITTKLNNKYEELYKSTESIKTIATVVSNGKDKEYKTVYKIKIDNQDTYLLLDVNKKMNVTLEYGNKIKIEGTYREPSEQTNYKGFDYKEYLKTQKVYGTLKADKIEIVEENSGNEILKFCNDIFLIIKERVKQVLPEKVNELFLGIMLGYTDELDEEIKQSFQDNNISHILAVSGMHISYIVIGVFSTLKAIIGKQKARIFTILILIIYSAITGFAPSVVRATIMGILSLTAVLINRKNDIWTSISCSLLIILIYNPFLITNVGVLLSYAGTIGIIVFNKNTTSILERIRFKDKKYKHKSNKKLRKIINILKENLSITISAQILIMPITILYFNVTGISFFIVNLIVSLIIVPIVILGFLAIIISIISIELLKIISVFITPLLQILISISEIGNKLPLNKIYLSTPNYFQVIIYYFLIFILNYLYTVYSNKNLTTYHIRIKNLIALFKFKYRQNKKKVISLILIASIIVISINMFPGNLKIYFIDVGQGDSTLIITPHNKKILVDGGGSLNEQYDVGKNTLIPYLLDRNVSKIDYMIISHFDQDHVGGLITVLEEMTVNCVIISRQVENSTQYEEFKSIVEEKDINVLIVKAGNRINIEKNLYFQILHPTEETITENAMNNNAMVAKLVYNDFSMLFTGDIEEIAEKAIIERYKGSNILKSTCLKVAHHGSKTSSTEEFLELVSPEIALIGVGKNNLYNHPSEEVITRLNNMRCKNI